METPALMGLGDLVDWKSKFGFLIGNNATAFGSVAAVFSVLALLFTIWSIDTDDDGAVWEIASAAVTLISIWIPLIALFITEKANHKKNEETDERLSKAEERIRLTQTEGNQNTRQILIVKLPGKPVFKLIDNSARQRAAQ